MKLKTLNQLRLHLIRQLISKKQLKKHLKGKFAETILFYMVLLRRNIIPESFMINIKHLQYLLPETEIEVPSKPVRLGKFYTKSTRTKPRLLKIVLPSEIQFMMHFIKLIHHKKICVPGNLKISTDKTPRQQEYYHKLEAEPSRRTSNGKNNL